LIVASPREGVGGGAGAEVDAGVAGGVAAGVVCGETPQAARPAAAAAAVEALRKSRRLLVTLLPFHPGALCRISNPDTLVSWVTRAASSLHRRLREYRIA
jgi:hypothetical protein